VFVFSRISTKREALVTRKTAWRCYQAKIDVDVVHRFGIKNNLNQILRKALKRNIDGERNILYQVTSKSSKIEAKRTFHSLYHCPLPGSTIHIANTCFLSTKGASSILLIPLPNILVIKDAPTDYKSNPYYQKILVIVKPHTPPTYSLIPLSYPLMIGFC